MTHHINQSMEPVYWRHISAICMCGTISGVSFQKRETPLYLSRGLDWIRVSYCISRRERQVWRGRHRREDATVERWKQEQGSHGRWGECPPQGGGWAKEAALEVNSFWKPEGYYGMKWELGKKVSWAAICWHLYNLSRGHWGWDTGLRASGFITYSLLLRPLGFIFHKHQMGVIISI